MLVVQFMAYKPVTRYDIFIIIIDSLGFAPAFNTHGANGNQKFRQRQRSSLADKLELSKISNFSDEK